MVSDVVSLLNITDQKLLSKIGTGPANDEDTKLLDPDLYKLNFTYPSFDPLCSKLIAQLPVCSIKT